MANRLREERLKKGLSLEQVGKDLNLATNTISRYETGKREPKLETWQKLADFFGVSVPYLQGVDYLTENTKYSILEILTFEYFENLDFDNPTETHNLSDLTDSVNNLLKAKNVKKFPLEFYDIKGIDDYIRKNKLDNFIDPMDTMTSSMEKYWLKYFSFLFDDFYLVQLVNDFLNKGGSTYSPSNEIIYEMINYINRHILKKLASEKGKRILEKYLDVLDAKYLKLLTDLSIVKTSSDAENAFMYYEDFIEDIELAINKNDVSTPLENDLKKIKRK